MTFDSFLFFLIRTLLISAAPGPNMLLAFQFGLNYGFKKTLWTLAGLSVGLFLLLAVSLLGLGFISEKAPFLLTIIKVLGALYLTYLGVKSWIHANQDFTTNDVKVVPTPSELFKTEHRLMWLNRLCGVVFVLIALMLLSDVILQK